MKSKELVELQQIEKKVTKKLNTHKKVEKKLFDTYLKKLDKWVDSESELPKQNAKYQLEAYVSPNPSDYERSFGTFLKGG